MILDDGHITISFCSPSKTTSEISLTHRRVLDLFGEIKTVSFSNQGACVHAVIYEKSRKIYSEKIDLAGDCYRVSSVPFKIAVTNVQNELLAKMKAIMQEVALSREVVAEEQEAFIKMLENACKAFPNFSRKQSMQLALEALRAKRKRQPAAANEGTDCAAT